MMRDSFRPMHDPAKYFYDVAQKEAEKRTERDVDDWIKLERESMWRTARDFAQQHNLRVPTLKEIEKAESCACGHTDYLAKWVYGVMDLLRRTDK